MFYNHGTKQIGQLNRRKTVAEKSCQKEISFNYEHRRKMMKKKTTTIVVRYSVVTSNSINISISRIAIREILPHVQLQEGIYQVLCQKIKTENTNHGVVTEHLAGGEKVTLNGFKITNSHTPFIIVVLSRFMQKDDFFIWSHIT